MTSKLAHQIIFKIYLIIFPLLLIGGFVQSQTVTYTSSDEDFMNPDRGFYHPVDVKSSNYIPLSLSDLQSKRTTPYMPWQGNYTVRTSLILRHFIMDSFVGVDNLSQTFLDAVQADFDIARQAGVRLIVRFSYTIDPNTSCGSSACPPYGDAPKARVLLHINQLKPYLQNNSDVIAVVQCGFIGVWGENYYTDYFGDPSSNGDGKITNANWQHRMDMLDSLLNAVPASRMIQLRYPQLKQKYVYGITAPVTSAAMTSTQAHNGSDISRLGFHNDCLLAASDDFGTYWDYGSDTSTPSDQTPILKPYFAADGKFTVVGGETCGGTYIPQNDCSSVGGIADTDIAALHYSFVNSDYNNPAVNNDWETGNCMDDIKRKLGYRFEMIDGTYPSAGVVGSSVNFTLNVENVGYAAPFNERTLQMVLRNTTTNAEYKANISGTNSDTRFWHTGTVALTGTFTPPNGTPDGDYQLLLHILDPSNNNAIANRPEYSIRMANLNTWESSTGYNDLGHTISISNVSCNITIDGNFGDWDGINNISTSGTGGLTFLKAADNATHFYVNCGTTIDANFQIFIDTDNDATGSNEYLNTNWSSTGFNYMIENGSVFHYTGTGTDWSWSFVGAGNFVKNTSGLELEVAKSVLTGMASNINIALASLNSSWTEIAHIPSGNLGAAYNLTNSIPCNTCNNSNLTLSGNLLNSTTYETDGTIESTQNISGGTVVIYDSKTDILLKPGFRTNSNPDFHAFINGCNVVPFQSEPTEQLVEDFSEKEKKKLKSSFTIYPNPFEGNLQVEFELLESDHCTLTIFNALGKRVLQPFFNRTYEVGNYSLPIDTHQLSGGIYFIQLRVGKNIFTKKIVSKTK